MLLYILTFTLGDTALHIAIKQKKLLCVSILLLLKAKTAIPNAEGKTAEELSHEILHRSLQDILNNSWVNALYFTRAIPNKVA